MSEKYKILSLCGGGVRGIMTATIMERLHQYKSNFLEEFDLLAGTSAGSFIISSLLGNYSAEGLGRRIAEFVKDYQPQTKNRTDPSKPMHNIQDFVDTVTAIHNGNPSLKSFEQKVIMTSFDLGHRDTGRLWNQMVFTNLDVPLDVDERIKTSGYGETPEMGIVDATVSSCAMGGMYGAHKFSHKDKTYYCVDGAFAHHDPTLIAIAYAMSTGVPAEDIVVIDIGTGYMPQSLGSNDVAAWGCQQWVQAPNGDQNLVPDLLANQPFSVPVLDLTLNGTNSTLLELQAKLMLGKDRYANINPRIKDISETDNLAIPYLIEHGMLADLSHAKKLIDLYW